MTTLDPTAALVVVDMQEGFDDPMWGATSNRPGCEDNVTLLLEAWRRTGRPVVVVHHDDTEEGSALAPDHAGHALMPMARDAEAALTVGKQVNSAFYGDPDLHAWLQEQGIGQLVVCGIQTNMCVETTARMAGNLGYDVLVPLDATRTFDVTGPQLDDGPAWAMTADELMKATAVSLHGGEFATVTTTRAVLDAV